MIRIKHGLDLPVSGVPRQVIETAAPVNRVGVVGADYHGMKPTMKVQEGDRVKLGQPLFADKKNPGVLYTAPAAGIVTAINRGAQRALQSVVISVDGDDEVVFKAYPETAYDTLDEASIRDNLLQSGLWTALRTRPFSKVPAVDARPSSVFVTAIDTHPLAADPVLAMGGLENDFRNGLRILARIAPVVVCAGERASLPVDGLENVRVEQFAGPHPAGLPGTHIHFVDPVSATHQVWQVHAQDVVAIGKLFLTGRLWVECVVALGGPAVSNPRLLRARLGASLDDLTDGELENGNNRVVSQTADKASKRLGALLFSGRGVIYACYEKLPRPSTNWKW